MWITPSALFLHKQRIAPRGFVLPRFVNVDRQHPAATVALRSTSKNLQESRLTAARHGNCSDSGKADPRASETGYAHRGETVFHRETTKPVRSRPDANLQCRVRQVEFGLSQLTQWG